jgi:hypothetical protein
MTTLFKSKGFLTLIALFIFGMFIYNFFLKSDTPVAENDSALTVGKELLKLSQDLSKAELSQALFSLPSYVYLTDFSAPVPQEPLGRVNPFDTIGR